jgi:hypothetical protein
MNTLHPESAELYQAATARGDEWKKRGGVFCTNVEILDYSKEQKSFIVKIFNAVWSDDRDSDGIFVQTKPTQGRELRGIRTLSSTEVHDALIYESFFRITDAARERLFELNKIQNNLFLTAGS